MVAPSIVAGSLSSTKYTAAVTQTLTVNKTNARAGDLLVVIVRAQSPMATDITFTEVTKLTSFTPKSNLHRITVIAAKYCATVADIPDTVTSTQPSGGVRAHIMGFLVRGADSNIAAYPINTPYGGTGTMESKSNIIEPMTVTTNSLSIAASGAEFTASNADEPLSVTPNWTQLTHIVSDGGITQSRTGLDVYSSVNSGTSTARFEVGYVAVSAPGAAMLTINPSTTPPPAKQFTFKTATGTATGTASVYDGTKGVVLTDILALNPQQSPYVSDWMAKQPMYSVHRGGSAVWPEHTMRAYTNAVWHGATMLEVSVNLTSDGVFVCSHDPTMTTSDTDPTFIIKDHTWAEVQQLTQSGLPVMRLEELLETYAKTRPFMVDDKTSVSHIKLFDMLESYFPHDASDRFLLKGYGKGGFFAAAKAGALRGYKSWGYFYDDEPTTTVDMASRVETYTMLGMNWYATQTQWNAILAFGKPVLAHVPANLTALQTAMTRGAHGAQCGDPLTMIPQINQLP